MSDIIAKVSKLLELAKSENEHEASLAGARAAELMAKHQIQMAEVMGYVRDAPVEPELGRLDADDDAPWSKRLELWKTTLAVVVADAFGGKTFYRGNKHYTLHMVGPPDSVNAARYMYAFLFHQVNALSRRAMRERAESNSFRRAYAAGMVNRIGVRLREGRTAGIGSSTALVRVEAAVVAKYESMGHRASKAGGTQRPDGRLDGWRDGEHVDLAATPRESLTSGNKRLTDGEE